MTSYSVTSDEQKRRAAVTSALRFAARHPSLGLGYEFQSDVQAAFGTRRELVQALQELWLDTVCRRLDQLLRDPRRGRLGRAQLARIAWAESAATNPCLRRALERHADEIAPSALQVEELLLSTGSRRPVPARPESFARVFPVSAACVA
jgi:hypothetical protein